MYESIFYYIGKDTIEVSREVLPLLSDSRRVYRRRREFSPPAGSMQGAKGRWPRRGG